MLPEHAIGIAKEILLKLIERQGVIYKTKDVKEELREIYEEIQKLTKKG